MNYILLAIVIPIGVYDIILAIKDKTTISQAYQKLLPTWADIIVFHLRKQGTIQEGLNHGEKINIYRFNSIPRHSFCVGNFLGDHIPWWLRRRTHEW
jgi:hypothetical protein